MSRDVTASRVSPHAGRRFDSFDLPPEVRAGIQRAGFTHCTPIQEKVLPLTLGGRDVAGQAQTGTGKTAAFLITIFTRLLARQRPGRPAAPRALVIAPTRELVVQIAADARLLGEATPFTIHAVYGGIDYRKQRADVQSGVDVLIGTPGRLIDYFKQRVYDLRSVEILVIDEADRMFDMGFIKDLRYILRQLPSYDRRQSMLFSATLTHDVMELAYVFMNDAVRVSVHNLGKPIPEHELPHLFDAFHRTSSASTSNRVGWGLGLTLVRGCAEAHGFREEALNVATCVLGIGESLGGHGATSRDHFFQCVPRICKIAAVHRVAHLVADIMEPRRLARSFGARLREEDRFTIPLGHLDEHVGKRTVLVVPHRDRGAFPVPLVVRVEVPADQIDE